ncbi:MAG TPA: Mur ligase family protein [Spirochaetota bacterium]|nr:Mur ligase family protein [Spirochaetota bacterium]HPV42785.1 Mur ligase family protein [Spirochaetota bacterium]
MIPEKLDRFLNNETRFDDRHYGLRNISALLGYFGDPHLRIPSFHIAGTNGKGSVAHMLNAIMIGAGYNTGLYTSPHLLEIHERIRLQNAAIDDRQFEVYIDEIARFVDADGSIRPTYFDVLTVCAFRYFFDSHADCAVIETGLGGRLDSTNVIIPRCSIITDISFDHVGILGNTLSAISREKAGIIKDGVPLVTSNTDPEILEPIITIADHHGAPLYIFSRDFHAHNISETDAGFKFDYSLHAEPPASINTLEFHHPLEKQVANASCAATAAVITRSDFPLVTDAAVRNGIYSFEAPGRFQTLCRNPLIIFDPAHNESALSEMVRLVIRRFSGRDATFVLSLMKDKEITSIMTMLSSLGMKAVYYILDDPRCYRPEPGAHPEVLIKIVDGDDSRLAAELDGYASDTSLFFFTGSFRLYRTALNYAEHAGAKCT